MEPAIFEKTGEWLKDSVEAIGKSFEHPDDDWAPVASFTPESGAGVLMLMDGSFFESDASKDALMEKILLPSINELGARVVGMVLCAWMAHVPEGENPEDQPMPSEHPDRREVVVVNIFDHTQSKSWLAEIKRDGENPPVLGKWQEAGKGMAGRFAEGVQDAIRDNDGQINPDFLENFKEIDLDEEV